MNEHFHFKLFLIFIFPLFIPSHSFSQAPLAKQWDARFGYDSIDWLAAFEQTSDGGYLLGGYSYSGIGGDKTQGSWGNGDYWIVKIDANGGKQWDKNYGGTGMEFFTCVQQTSDGGYIIGGYTDSGISGDKTQASAGSFDFWILKLDALGNKQWDKSYGGSNDDALRSICQTDDGGYILGGQSDSPISGDKSQAGWGFTDYWIIKIDSSGVKQWDKDFGGTNQDFFYQIRQTTDGGYILGGHSASGANGNKTQASWGGADYWIIKTDANGIKQWDKDFGGIDADALFSIRQTLDGGFILGGHSKSGVSGNKTQPSQGDADYWIIKTDSAGNKIWEKDYGGSYTDENTCSIQQTIDGGYFVCGGSSSSMSGDKSENNLGVFQSWIIKMDTVGNLEWEKTILTTPEQKLFPVALQSSDGCYVIAQGSTGTIAGHKSQPNYDAALGSHDYWIIKFCDTSQVLLPVAAIATTTPICPGTCADFINLSTNATSYQWDFPGGTPSSSVDINPANICYNSPGNYSVTLIATGQGGSDTLVLPGYITVYPFPLPQGIIQNGDTLFAIPGSTSYQWYFNGNMISGATDYYYTATASGNYNVVATDSNGCEVEAVMNNVIAKLDSGKEKDAVRLYPNPVGSKLYVTGLTLSGSSSMVSVYDMLGEKVVDAQRELNGVDSEMIVDLSRLLPGIYFIEIISDGKSFRAKFVKSD